MFVTYPIQTYVYSQAVELATKMAKASGYQRVTFIKSVQTGPSSWDITLSVS